MTSAVHPDDATGLRGWWRLRHGDGSHDESDHGNWARDLPDVTNRSLLGKAPIGATYRAATISERAAAGHKDELVDAGADNYFGSREGLENRSEDALRKNMSVKAGMKSRVIEESAEDIAARAAEDPEIRQALLNLSNQAGQWPEDRGWPDTAEGRYLALQTLLSRGPARYPPTLRAGYEEQIREAARALEAEDFDYLFELTGIRAKWPDDLARPVMDSDNWDVNKSNALDHLASMVLDNASLEDSVDYFARLDKFKKAVAGDMTSDIYYQVASEKLSDMLVQGWASSSNKNPWSQVLQRAVGGLFGTTEAFDGGPSEVDHEAGKALDRFGSAIDVFVRSVYDRTQARFEEQNITAMTLARGLALNSKDTFPGFERGDREIVSSNPLSSWTTRTPTAKQFVDWQTHRETKARGTIHTLIPVERIWSTPMTGPGCLNEYECILLGGDEVPDTVEVGDWAEFNDATLSWELTHK